ncbi:MAG: pyridoxal-dependent decarboxylase [Gammaproteobacteria bacterium]|nr:pyridoxal-dependent decarboxylase [Gammaproteobacteria bacterium]
MRDDKANLLVELQRQIDQLSTMEDHPLSFPDISDHPCDNTRLQSTLGALINEGDLHRADNWAAHMTPCISASSLLGQLLAGIHNGNLLSPQLYPALAKIEQQMIGWLCQLFQQQHGHFIAGSSYANMEALWQAKQHSKDASRVVYTSSAAHYSIAKACQILDLKLETIATNDYDQLLPDALQQACTVQRPLAIVATIGTPAAGAIDPLADCIRISQQFESWCHIDAAWGGALSILPGYKTLFDTASHADSICFDPHKGWQQPKPASILLYQHPLSPMLSADTSYLERPPLLNFHGSRGGEFFLPLWLTLMHSGIDDLREQVQQRLQQANSLAKQLQKHTDWHVHQSETGIVCFRPASSVDLTDLVNQRILSKAKVAGQDVYRAVFASSNTRANAVIAELEPYF